MWKKKSVSAAYGYWALGFLCGFFGSHRFYVGRFKSAVAMLLMPVTGLIILAQTFIGAYMAFSEKIFAAAANTDISSGIVGNLDLTQGVSEIDLTSPRIIFAACLAIVGGVWHLVDVFFIPRMFRQHEDRS